MICNEYFVGHETGPTVVQGIPSTRINRRSFLTASLRSAADRTLDEDLGNAKILLNDFAVSEVEGFEDIPSRLESRAVIAHLPHLPLRPLYVPWNVFQCHQTVH